MSNFPNSPNYARGGANGQYAVMTPPPRQEKNVLPLAYTAGGGLLVGVVAGLILISGGSATKAVAANEPAVETASAEPGAGKSAPLEEPATVEAGAVSQDEPATAEPATAEPATAEPATAEPATELEPAPVQAALSFDVTPADVQADIKIEVDGERLEEGAELLHLTFDPGSELKSVRVVAVASGYRDFEKSIKVTGDTRVAIKMRKVAEPKAAKKSGENNGRRKAPKKANKKTAGPGGLLDL